jgi:hypothetical protein
MTAIKLPDWTGYTADTGSIAWGEYLEQSGTALGGLRIVHAGNGKVALDVSAGGALQRQPDDADGYIDDEMQMWLGGTPYAVQSGKRSTAG